MNVDDYIQNFVDKMKQGQEILLEFLEKEENEEGNYQKLIQYFDDHKFKENKYELKIILHMISKITENHQRSLGFLAKTERILKTYENDIKKHFTNFNLFNIFKSNKRILLFLFEENIIKPDRSIYLIISNEKYKERNYLYFFKPEFGTFFDAKLISEIQNDTKMKEKDSESFKEKRRKGVNDNFICEIIRNDSIDEFITIVDQQKVSLSSTIEESIYETNSFLLNHKPTLIEYAAFCGSIQIFKYLNANNIEYSTSLWLNAIHSNNSELIHSIEEKNIELSNKDYEELYKEAVKCHHNDILKYFKNKIIENEEKIGDLFSYCLHFCNFVDLCDNNLYNFSDEQEFNRFYLFCKYDYYSIVNFLIQNTSVNINQKRIIYKKYLFIHDVQKKLLFFKCNLYYICFNIIQR